MLKKNKLRITFCTVLVVLLAYSTTSVALGFSKPLISSEIELTDELNMMIFSSANKENASRDEEDNYQSILYLSNGCLLGYERKEHGVTTWLDSNSEITYFDFETQAIWRVTDEQFEGCRFSIVKEDDDYIYLGTSKLIDEWVPSVSKLSKTGEVVYQFVGDESVSIHDFIVLHDGSIMCIGSKRTKDDQFVAYSAHISADGIIEQQHEYRDINDGVVFRTLEGVPSGSVLIASDSTNTNFSLFLIDNYGDVIDKHEMELSIPQGSSVAPFFHRSNDDLFLVFYIRKIDSTGNPSLMFFNIVLEEDDEI